jgi:hypothetical protein
MGETHTTENPELLPPSGAGRGEAIHQTQTDLAALEKNILQKQEGPSLGLRELLTSFQDALTKKGTWDKFMEKLVSLFTGKANRFHGIGYAVDEKKFKEIPDGEKAKLVSEVETLNRTPLAQDRQNLFDCTIMKR